MSRRPSANAVDDDLGADDTVDIRQGLWCSSRYSEIPILASSFRIFPRAGNLWKSAQARSIPVRMRSAVSAPSRAAMKR